MKYQRLFILFCIAVGLLGSIWWTTKRRDAALRGLMSNTPTPTVTAVPLPSAQEGDVDETISGMDKTMNSIDTNAYAETQLNEASLAY